MKTSLLYKVLVLLFLLSATHSSCQTTISVKVAVDNSSSKASIDFFSDSVINDVLVIITSSKGETIFMDHRSRFKGIYKQTIDLSPTGKDEYSLKVTLDDSSTIKQLKLK